MWGPLRSDQFCASAPCPKFEKPENVVGGQAVLFSEIVRTKEDLDNAIWPRLLAVAERLWHEAEWESLPGETPEGQQEDYTGLVHKHIHDPGILH